MNLLELSFARIHPIHLQLTISVFFNGKIILYINDKSTIEYSKYKNTSNTTTEKINGSSLQPQEDRKTP
jgi:hypothetical protein